MLGTVCVLQWRHGPVLGTKVRMVIKIGER